MVSPRSKRLARLRDKIEKKRKFCPHCKSELAQSVFYRHKSKYFDKATGTWNQDACKDSGTKGN